MSREDRLAELLERWKADPGVGAANILTEDRLAELLERWKSAQTTGPELTVEDFCRDCPDLVDDFRKLVRGLGPAKMVQAGAVSVQMGEPGNTAPTAEVKTVAVGDIVAETLAEEFVADVDAGRYKPVHFHARGGLGMVFVAEDGELGRRVALKCMQRRAAANSASRRRFVFEAEITGKLEHPGIVPVYGLGQDARGKPYYAMRFIEGQTLGDAVERYHKSSSANTAERNVELRRLLRHFIAVCETMAYAHNRGVIHRDLKPANIMIGPYGETLIVDWGLAKYIAAADTGPDAAADLANLPAIGRLSAADPIDVSVIGQAKGSPAYMSPEQARGEWDRVGPASDIYNLGSTLFVLLTGKIPYPGRGIVEVVDKVRRGDCLTPHAANPLVPLALSAICRKAMSFRPEDRYAGARDLAGDLERWLADEPVSAWKEPLAVRARRWLKQNRTLVTTSVAALLVGLFATIALAVQERQRGNEKREAYDKLSVKTNLLEEAERELTTKNFDLEKANKNLTAAKNEAVTQRDRAEDSRRLARKTLYPAVMNVAAAALAEHQYERAAGLLREVMPEPGDPIDHRRFEWFNTWNSLNKARLRSFPIAANPHRLQMSADGSILAAHCGSDVIVYRTADGERILTLPSLRFSKTFDLARDGSFLIFKEGKNIEIWGLPANGKPEARQTIKAFDNRVSALALSADQRRIVAAGDNGRIRVWDARDGQRLDDIDQYVEKKVTYNDIDPISTSPDGRWLAFRIGLRPVLYSLVRKAEAKLEVPPGDYPSIELTDGDHVFVRTKEQVWSWPLSAPLGFTAATAVKRPNHDEATGTWEVPSPGEGPKYYVRGPRRIYGFRTPIGRDYFVMFGEPSPRELPAVSFDIPVPHEVQAFTLRPDGKVLVCADPHGLVTLLDADKAPEPELLLRHPNETAVVGLAFMPDGKLLSFSEKGGFQRARPREVPDLKLLPEVMRTLGPGSIPNASMALSPDRRWLALQNKKQVNILDAVTNAQLCAMTLKQSGLFISSVPMAFVPGQAILALANVPDDGPGRTPFDGKPSQLLVWDFGSFTALGQGSGLIGGAMVQRLIEAAVFPRSLKGLNVGVHINALDVSSDGQWIAAACRDGVVRIYRRDKLSARPARQLRAGAALLCVGFSPDGAWVAAGAADGSVWIWPLKEEGEPLRIPAHRDAVRCLIFDRDGRTLISGGKDGQVKFLIRELPQERFSFNTGAPVASLALSPDGLSLAVGDDVGYVRLYSAAAQDTVLNAARKSWEQARDSKDRTRNLLLALWASYLDRKSAADPAAKKLLQEAIEVGAKMDEKSRAPFAGWLQAFAEEMRKVRGK